MFIKRKLRRKILFLKNFLVKSYNLVISISMYIFSTYDAYVVEMSSRSKKVGYIRMSNDRIHFESLMFYIFPHSISAVLVLIWKIKSLNGTMILFFRYKLHVYDISIYFQGHWNNFIFRFNYAS